MYTEKETREELVKACKVLQQAGIVDLAGHISARLPDGKMLIKPRSVSWLDVKADDLQVMDINWRPRSRDEKPPAVEWPIPAGVYNARGQTSCVLHAHPPDSTLLSSLDIAPEPLTRDLFYFAKGVPVYDDKEYLLNNDALIRTPESGADVAQVLGDK